MPHETVGDRPKIVELVVGAQKFELMIEVFALLLVSLQCQVVLPH